MYHYPPTDTPTYTPKSTDTPTDTPMDTPTETPTEKVLFWDQVGLKGLQSSCGVLGFSVSTSLMGMIKMVYPTTSTAPDGNGDPIWSLATAPEAAAGLSIFPDM